MALTRVVTDFKDSVKAATTTNVTLSGGAPNTLDGISLSVNDSVLVKDQSTPSQNGVYRVTTLGTGANGTWTRRNDFNSSNQITAGALVFIEQGTISGNVYYYLAGGLGTVTVDSTSLTFSNLYTSIASGIASLVYSNSNVASYLPTYSGTLTAGSVTTKSGGQLTGYLTGAIGANTANSGVFTTLSASSTTSLNNYANIYIATGSTAGTSALSIVGNIYGQGGTGYLDILKATNTYSAATNSSKYIRLNSTGGIEIINSAYSAIIFTLSDTGNLTIGGGLYVTTGLYWAANSNVISTGGGGGSPAGSSGQMQYNNGGTFGAASLYYYTGNSAIISTGTTVSSSTTTGALQSAGGLGVVGNIYAGGGINGIIGNGTAAAGTFTTLTATSGYQGAASGALNGTLGATTPNSVVATSVTTTSAGQITGYHTGAIGANVANTGAFTTITSTSTIIASGNIVASSGTTSTSTTTGSLVATGGIGAAGNVYVGGNIFQGGRRVSWTFVQATTPSGPVLGDSWYKSGSDILYQYVNDGTSSFWIDLTTKPSTFANLSITSNLAVSGNISTSLVPAVNNIYNLGSSSFVWATVYGTTFSGVSTTAKYADLAENYTSDKTLIPGQVVVFGGEAEVTLTSISHDRRIAGVVSTNPAYLMNSELSGYSIALTGRVPCYVKGPIEKGDMLASSSFYGVAIKVDDELYKPGCVIGKSLENISTDEIKQIEVVVGRF
jgi:hypothetical protein